VGHVNVDWVKIATKSKLRGFKRVVFFRGPKSQLWETQGAKSVINPYLYWVF